MKRAMLYFNRIVIFGVLTTLPLHPSFGGSETGNGGGRAEQNFMHALVNLERYYTGCMNSGICDVTGSERLLLRRIISELRGVGNRKALLVFKSGNRNSGFFFINGNVRIARTGSQPKDTIFINEELIYAQNYEGRVVSVDVAEAAAILTHEFGHHHGVSDERALDLLGAKVRSYILSNTLEVQHPTGANLTILNYAINRWDTPIPASGFASPEITVSLGDTVQNLTRPIERTLSCPAISDLGKPNLYGTRLTNPRWLRTYKAEVLPVAFQSNLEYLCGSDPKSAVWVYGDSQIRVALSQDAKRIIEIRLITCWIDDGECQ